MTHRARREGLWLGKGVGNWRCLPQAACLRCLPGVYIHFLLLLWQIITNTIWFNHTVLWKSDRDHEEIRSRCQLCSFLSGDWWEKLVGFCSVSRSWLPTFLEPWLSPPIKANCVKPLLVLLHLLSLLLHHFLPQATLWFWIKDSLDPLPWGVVQSLSTDVLHVLLLHSNDSRCGHHLLDVCVFFPALDTHCTLLCCVCSFALLPKSSLCVSFIC